MRWVCKICSFESEKRGGLLKHYRLQHGHGGRSQSVPCLHIGCPCSLKTFNALQINLSEQHVQMAKQSGRRSLSCLLCSSCVYNSEYFEHLWSHLRKFEVVACVFKNCNFSTNVNSTFVTQRHRKHHLHSIDDFKKEV